MTGLLIASVLLPVAALLLCPWRRARARLPVLLPWAPLPALALAVFAPPGLALEIPWLLFGVRFGLDATGRAFLLFTALLWAIAGWYARAYLAADARRARFAGFFLATLAGNLGLILAQDVASFYLFFALMTFAAYGLVVHDGTAAARRAGRVYLVMAVTGEALLVVGFLLLVSAGGTLDIARAVSAAAATPARETIVALLLAGLGIKLGVAGLHLWLPLAHPVAPVPASAVLSGAIIKAGLLGWLRFLPLGEAGSGWAVTLIVAGLVAAFYGVAVGLAQRDAKVVLAYSSVSQMGLMTVGVGAGLLAPAAWAALLPAVTLYAAHHALAKGALFLGAGVARAGAARYWPLAGLLLPAASLAGAPFTSGVAAKHYLSEALAGLPEPWPATLGVWLAVAAVGSTLLMARFLWVVWRETRAAGDRRAGLVVPWVASLAAVAAVVWWLAPSPVAARAFSAEPQWSGAWPVLAGATLAWLAARRLRRLPLALPPGDLLLPLETAWRALARGWQRIAAKLPPAPAWQPRPVMDAAPFERTLLVGAVTGGAVLLLLALLVALLAVS